MQRSWGADSMPWPLANYIAFSGYTDKPMDFRFPSPGIAAVLTSSGPVGAYVPAPSPIN